MQLPEVVAQPSEAGKKRRLSESNEIIDLDDDGGDDNKPVNEGFSEVRYCPLTIALKRGVSLQDLVAVNTPKNTGRKAKLAAERLSISCVRKQTGKPYWRCVAPECKHFQAGNRQLSRILLHAMGCSHLSPKLKDFANDTAIAENSLGAKLRPMQIQANTESQTVPYKKAKTVQETLADIVIPAGKIKLQDQVNLAIVELIAVSGVPASVLDSSQWKNFMEVATRSKCNSPSSTTLMEKLIPAEAALVRKNQTDFLRTHVNLTLTFDGGSTRKPSSVYTLHITTMERETFFMEGHDATNEHHTAEYIEGLATKVSKTNSNLPCGLTFMQSTACKCNWT